MRCPSVRLSRSYILSKRIKISSKFFSPSGSHTILVFLYQTSWQYSDGNLLNGGLECRWGRLKSRYFAINNCCSLVCILHFATSCLFTAGIGRPSATRCKQSRLSVIVYSARPTKRGLALYTFIVVRESCVWQQGSTLDRRQQNRIELYVLANMKSK